MTVLNLQVTSGANDAYDVADVSYDASSVRFNAGTFDVSNFNYRSAARFVSVSIGNGETINTAAMTLRASTTHSGTDCRTKLSCFDEDNASLPASSAAWNGASKTTAQTDWDIATVWSVDSDYTSADFSASIQEIVDRGGWSSGNALVVDWSNDGSPTSANNLRRAYSYNGSSTYAPKLDIDYTAGGGGGAAIPICMYHYKHHLRTA